MKILIVGAGSVGKRHMNNAISLGASVSVVDPREDRLIECSNAEYKFVDMEEAVNLSWDGVLICSPPVFHIEQIVKSQKFGVPIFVEKPLSHSIDEAVKVLGTDNVLVGYSYRWWEPIVYFKSILDSGCLGNILHVNACMAAHLEDWHPWENYTDFFMAHKHLGGGALLDESHILDLMLWFFGWPEFLCSQVSKVSSLNIDTDDNVDICMKYTNMNVIIHLDLYSRPHKKEITVVGENGTAEWHYDYVNVSCDKKLNKRFKIDRNDMFLREMIDYINLIKGKGGIRCNFTDGCNVLKLVSQINDSSNLERFVKCDQ